MRCLLVALGLIASTSTCGAFAQEFEPPTLRGSEAFIALPRGFSGWGGIYAGGQAGYANAGVDFANGVNDLASFIVRNSIFESTVSNFTTLPKASTNGSSVGWFAGYNSQWEGVILGFEVNYNHTALKVAASDSVSLRIANDATAPAGHHFIYDPFTVSGQAAIRITDIATFRARGGWTVGQFLPYAFLAVAVVRADVSRAATVSYTRTDVPDTTTPPTPPITPIPPATFGPVTQPDVKNGGFYYGYAGGLGVDICVMPSVFLRGEWEFVQIQSLRTNINNARVGIGVKF
jgi:outer membrane immunogenic protein